MFYSENVKGSSWHVWCIFGRQYNNVVIRQRLKQQDFYCSVSATVKVFFVHWQSGNDFGLDNAG